MFPISRYPHRFGGNRVIEESISRQDFSHGLGAQVFEGVSD